MRAHEFLAEDIFHDEPPREFENPVPHDVNKLDDAFEYMDEIDGILVTLYKEENDIDQFPSGRAWGQAVTQQRKKYGKVMDVPISKMMATETHLEKGHLDKILRGGDIKVSSEMPILYLLDGTYFVGDGNHRVAAELIRGNDSVRALVIDGNKFLR